MEPFQNKNEGAKIPLLILVIGLVLVQTTSAFACRLKIVLAMDISASVDAKEDQLQRQGMARALLDEQVTSAFFASKNPVALAVIEWNGPTEQNIISNWRMVYDLSDLHHISTTISNSIRGSDLPKTAMGEALLFSKNLLDAGPNCASSKIDLSADGSNNSGPSPFEIYSQYFPNDIQVNGLAINAAEFEAELHLIEYFKTNVIRGEEAFLIIADGFDDFERAMREKLLMEIYPNAFLAKSN
jgi:hypothetical protein